MGKAKLYIKQKNRYVEVSGIALGPNVHALSRVSLDDAIKKYLELCTSQKCLKNQQVERTFFGKFKDFIKNKQIQGVDEITPENMLEFHNSLSVEWGLKPSSVNRRFCTIKNFFVMCLKWKVIHENPCKDIKKKRVEANPYKNWTEKEFEKFIATTSGVWKSLLLFLWHTGCRPVEAKNLKWTDILYDEGELVLKCGKNAKVARRFPITDEVSKILHNTATDSLYVFSKDKKQIENDSLYHYAKKHLRRLHFHHISIYGMRHTFAERLAKANVSPFYIQKLMGHAHISTTMQYVHDDKNNLKQVLNGLKK